MIDMRPESIERKATWLEAYAAGPGVPEAVRQALKACAATMLQLLHPGPLRKWRHRKRQSIYTEIGRAQLQAATTPPKEGDTLVIYRDEAGILWAREVHEFEDGRFEELPR